MRFLEPGLGALLVLLLGACSGESATAELAPKGASDSPGNAGGAGASEPGATTPLPPEKEVESSFEVPVATKTFVWVTNPKSGRVAYVNASSLEVKTVEAGNGPTYLAAVPGQSDAAIVLNVLSRDATLLRAANDKVTGKTFKVGAVANTWSISADGRWAIAWSDHRKLASPPKTQGFQDVAVIDLTEKVPPVVLAVGYRPVSVAFSASGASAFAVTQDGISVVDLAAGAGPLVAKNVAVSENPLEDPGSRDVSVTPDGRYAFIRRDGVKDVTVVNLETTARTTVTLNGSVTDLDSSDTGSRAVAVVRDTATVAILPIPEIASAPTKFTEVAITGETVGSVALAPGGATGLLYSNAVLAERVTLLSMAATPPTHRTVKLYSPVLAVFLSKDASHALVIHDKVTAAPGAFSVVPVATALPAKIVETKAPPFAVAFSDANDRAIVGERGAKADAYGAYLVRLPQLTVDRFPLASPPTAVGLVAGAKRAYVAQQHPDGRITFIDLDTGTSRTLTGFELGARVVDGSQP